MSDEPANPTVELELRRASALLNQEADDMLEKSLRARLPLEQTLEALLPLLARHAGAQCAWIRTFDEELEVRDFVWPSEMKSLGRDLGVGASLDMIYEHAVERERHVERGDGITVIGQRLDVAGDPFGAAAIRIDQVLDGHSLERAQRLLLIWCEELDNHLAAIAMARRKHAVTRSLSRALKHPVLEQGIVEAIEALRAEVPFRDLLLVYRQQGDHAGRSLNYQIVRDGKLTYDSLRADHHVDEDARARLLRMVDGSEEGVPESFGISDYREEVLITGVRDAQVIGRLVIASPAGRFNTFDRDLLERFADYLRQRIVDFNREWKTLSLTFSRDVVLRLLQEENYRSEHLAAREEHVAVLYSDIAGFTRISEQVLREPALIGELINTWSERVVEIIWETGGVFDKMVGDCVIAHWGPPFFDLEASDACRRAADAALHIRDYTSRLHEQLPALTPVASELGVASGLNYCPMFVGLFGPNDDYTGFSSGMNNAARLQGVAKRDEILCMDSFVDALADEGRFGEPAEAKVKNVAAPLAYRPLLR